MAYVIRDKHGCEESYSASWTKGIRFRRNIGEQYSDHRNGRAELLLTALVESKPKLSDSQWQLLGPHFESNPKGWRDALAESTRAVGFKSNIRDFQSFIEHLVEALNEPVDA
jgi:hypothetical protein